MKKILLSLLGIVTIASIGFLAFNSFSDNTNMKDNISFDNRIVVEADNEYVANNVDELFEKSDLIIKAKLIDEPIYRYQNSRFEGVVEFGWTETRLKVQEVYKGDKNLKEVTITEPYWFEEETLYMFDEYMPTKVNGSYYLFLTKYPDGVGPFSEMYFPTDNNYGKYTILTKEKANKLMRNEELNNQELDIFEGLNNKKYSKWFKEVLKTLER